MQPTETTLDRVREQIVDCLGVEPEDVTPESKLISDLGAESIDFLDLSFRLEKEFGHKMFGGRFLEDAEDVNEDGDLTEVALAKIAERSPTLHEALKAEPSAGRLGQAISVQVVAEFMDNGGD